MLGRALFVCGFMIIPSYATAQSPLAVTYEVPPALTLHEPVIVTVTLQNLLGEPIKLDLGWNRKIGFVITVRDPGGQVVRPTITPSGVGRAGRIELEPNGEYSQPLVLNDWLPFDRSGLYHVEILLVGPIRTLSGRVVDGPRADGLNIQIGARNETLLQQSYQRLADAFMNSAGGVEQYQAAQVLKYLNDPVGVPILRTVLDATSSADPLILEALRKIGTPESLGVLQDMTKSNMEDRAALARNALERSKPR